MDMPFWKTFWKAVVPLDSTVDGAGPGQISRSTRGWMAAMTGLERMSLSFCSEVLGWEGVQFGNRFTMVIIVGEAGT